MKKFFIAVLFLITNNFYSQNEDGLKILHPGIGHYVFVVQHEYHEKYGLAFTLTSRFNIPVTINNLQAQKKIHQKNFGTEFRKSIWATHLMMKNVCVLNMKKFVHLFQQHLKKGDSLFILI